LTKKKKRKHDGREGGASAVTAKEVPFLSRAPKFCPKAQRQSKQQSPWTPVMRRIALEAVRILIPTCLAVVKGFRH